MFSSIRVETRRDQATLSIIVAVAFGLMESAWTRLGFSGPSETWLGILALFIAFFFVTFPNFWWIPGLAILEEGIHLIVGYGVLPSYDTFFHHWSVGYLGINIYPWITFPLATLVGELLYQKFFSMGKFVKIRTLHSIEESRNKFVKKKNK